LYEFCSQILVLTNWYSNLKIIRNLSIIYLLLVFSACGNSEKDEVLDQNKMVDILIDLHLAEATVENIGLNTDSAASLYKYLEKQVYDSHEISDSLYLRSINYYMENPKQLDRIYSIVVDSLSVREKILDLN